MDKAVDLMYCRSEDQKADVFTKPFSGAQLRNIWIEMQML